MTNLQLGASGSTYTSDKLGYYYVEKEATEAGQYLKITLAKGVYETTIAVEPGNICLRVLIQKNNPITIEYTTKGNEEIFTFTEISQP